MFEDLVAADQAYAALLRPNARPPLVQLPLAQPGAVPNNSAATAASRSRRSASSNRHASRRASSRRKASSRSIVAFLARFLRFVQGDQRFPFEPKH